MGTPVVRIPLSGWSAYLDGLPRPADLPQYVIQTDWVILSPRALRQVGPVLPYINPTPYDISIKFVLYIA